jgi:CheY-like chemotaxis protein
MVLIVEDDDDIRDALSQIIEERGVGVLAAVDGVEAMALLREGARPSAVFLDKWMPKLGGAAVLDAMRADPALAAIRVVWMSGDAREPPTGTEHLQKPFDMDRLLAIVGSLREPN